METVNHIKGGPQSMAYVGQVKIQKAEIDHRALNHYHNSHLTDELNITNNHNHHHHHHPEIGRAHV